MRAPAVPEAEVGAMQLGFHHLGSLCRGSPRPAAAATAAAAAAAAAPRAPQPTTARGEGGSSWGGGAASAAGEHLRLRLLQSDICHICHISTSYAGSPISRRLRPDSARGGGGGDGAACAGGEAVVQSSRSVVREAVVPLLVAVQDALRHRARQRQPHLGWFGLGPGSGLG